jgi:hypothetical protein
MIMRSRRFMTAVGLMVTAIAAMGGGASAAMAESHPFLFNFGSFSNPNGIAIDESSGDVYVADLATDTVYRFDASGNPVDFTALHADALTGAATPAGSFEFPDVPDTPAAIAVDNSRNPSDPSRGDLYVMDAGHGVIDKFSSSGEYLSQITGFEPATGSSGNALLGIGVDANGTVRVDLSNSASNVVTVDEFDDSSTNDLIANQHNHNLDGGEEGVPHELPVYGFAVGPTGDDYLLYGGSCSCAGKVGQQLAGLGQVDSIASGDVAIAADSASGHVYIDDQSSIAEWDTGAMNGSPGVPGTMNPEYEAAGTLISSFGSLQLAGSSGQGGIAVNGHTGEIYVSNPADGKVYVFASDEPAVSAGAASNVSEESATLNGTIDPRGAAVTSCEFEYGLADEFGRGNYEHSAPCQPAAADIGAGTGPVPVSAQIGGLEPGLLYRFRLKASNAGASSESANLVATLGTPFGIKKFELSFINEDGTPDTQAGSHPYEMVNVIELATRFRRDESNADSQYVRVPDGALKDLTEDLPPGLVGNPNATPKKCTVEQMLEQQESVEANKGCPAEALIGHLHVEYSSHIEDGQYKLDEPAFNVISSRGVALQIGIHYTDVNVFVDNGLLAGGDYPVQATIFDAPPEAPVFETTLRIRGVVGEGPTRKPFLTLPTGCTGPLKSTLRVDSYEEPNQWDEATSVTRNSAGTPVSLTGCSKLLFPSTISVSPDTTDASASSGLTVGVHVPQTAAFNPEGLAESSLRDTTVTLPEGVAINPAGADGLEACSEGLAGFTGFGEFNAEAEPGVKTATFTPEMPEPLQPGANFCPNGSKIGTVKIKTPLLEHELEGAVYLAAQNSNPFGSLVAMYLIAEDPASGSVIKLTGEVRLSETGQIVTTFKNTPDLPFEELQLHFFGGERAPLTTPSRCGTYTTKAVFTPWDGNGPVTSESSFQIEHGPNGGPCPGASLPFAPSLTAGTTSIQAGGFSPFTMTMSREDGQQNLQAISLNMPAGLSGLLSGVKLCGEVQANAGTCGPESEIGETIVSVGVGNDPFTVKGGKVYITGPYKGAPFGLSIVNPAVAGPFNLGKVIVRARIEVNPITAALTITSDNEGPYKIPQYIDGIPLQIKHVNVTINRNDFTFNPTNCNPMAITGSLDSIEGATDALSVPFQATNCAVLGFAPKFAASTSGKTSRVDGASLSVKLTYPSAPFGSQANIRQVKVELPKGLPSRLTTLQKACTAAQFHANPAGCPAGSIVGHAKAITPLVPVPLEGPAYFVSNGGEAYPNLIVVLQGYGVTIDLVGDTFISKAGITSSTFKTVPDAPVGSFELTLPEGPHSALTTDGNPCTQKLTMPTEFLAQNGAKLKRTTKIAVTGCPKVKQAAKRKHKHTKHGRDKRRRGKR